MRPFPSLALAGAALVVSVSFVARADVVRSPPTNCPPGEVGVTSHAGPRCVKEAPKDCPVGWRGRLGGDCALSPCGDDSRCEDGEACVTHSVCLEPFEDAYYDYGEQEEESEAGALASPPPRNLLGAPLRAPRMPRVKRPKPIYRYNAVNVCGGGAACAAPRTCQREKLCVPKGQTAAAYLGSNVDGARVARKTETPLVSSKVETPDVATTTTTAPPTTPTAPPPQEGRGCAGCQAAPAGGIACGVGAALALVLAAMRRRR
jgi:hypothetical protein